VTRPASMYSIAQRSRRATTPCRRRPRCSHVNIAPSMVRVECSLEYQSSRETRTVRAGSVDQSPSRSRPGGRRIGDVPVVSHRGPDDDECCDRCRVAVAMCALRSAVGLRPSAHRRRLCGVGRGTSDMSLIPIAPGEDGSVERWRQWQQRNAAVSRQDATRARVVFTVVLTVLGSWLGWQLLSSQLWP